MPSPDTGSVFGGGIVFGAITTLIFMAIPTVMVISLYENRAIALNIKLEEYRQEAVDLGFASYNSKTGSWEWNKKLPEEK